MTEQNDDNTHTHMVLTAGTMVHQYRIVEKIGAGGMGEVFLAEDTKLDRRVALKFLPAHLVSNADVRTRFVREAQTLAKLNHPNIVAIYDVSEFEGRPFYVMELVAGESLHHYAHEKPLPLDTIVEYAIQICQGLGESHRAGIIHRDIKSANLAVDGNGRIRLLDFGLAAHEEDDKITKTGSTLGTVAYMSPEQVSGRELDQRSDLFSFGAVIYELIAGRTPFKRDNEGATLRAIMEEAPEPLGRFKAEVPEKLQDIIDQLLEKDKEIRYQTAEGVIADLKRLTYDSRPSSYSSPTHTKPKRTGLIAGIATVALIGISAVAFFLSGSDTPSALEGDGVPMIAVLPFENLGSADDEYFADGMTEEITSRLAVIDGLGVISRTSAMQYKTSVKSLREIGSELGVQYILEGTVRWSKVGDQPRIRITPQLVRVADDRHMWAENYERALMEVFTVQAEIAERIVEQLGMTLVPSDRTNLATRPTENADAYRLYLRALNVIRHPEQMRADPTNDIDSAVVLDSTFALAHALRAEWYSMMAFGAPSSDKAAIALASAQKALELEPGLPQGHMALGSYYNSVETDYGRAMEEYAMARSEMHNNAELLGSIAFLQMRQGKIAEANANARKAAELDPLNSTRYLRLTWSLGFARKYDEAHEAIDRAIALNPEVAINYTGKMELLWREKGDTAAVRETAERALAHCDTLKFAKAGDRFLRLLPDLPWDDLIERERREIRDSSDSDTAYYSMMMNLAETIGDREMITVYADSMQPFAKKMYEDMHENPYANSHYGLLMAYLGDCKTAEEFGLNGKELMSTDDCHL